MKKRIIAAVIALSLLLMTVSGCGIIVKNVDRDLAQVVAVVGYDKLSTTSTQTPVYREKNKDNEYIDTKKIITKRQLVNAFNNVGQQYLQQFGTVEKAMEAIVKELVNREIILQEAVRQLTAGQNLDGKLYPSVEDCLTAEEKAEAEAVVYDEEYETIKSFFEDIKKEHEGKEDEEEDEEEEEEHPEHRTAQDPVFKDTEKYEPKYNPEEDEKFDTARELDYWKTAIRRYNKRLNQIETGLNREIYHDRMLLSEMEQKVIEKYQDLLEEQAMAKILATSYNYLEEGISDAEKAQRAQAYVEKYLLPRYQEKYTQQQQLYSKNISGFLSALDSYKGDYSLLYSPVNADAGYFYVKNMLVDFRDELKEEFDNIQSMDLTDAAKKEMRQKLLDRVTAKDLRDIYKHETDNKTGKDYDVAAEFPSYLPSETEKLASLKEGTEKEYEEVDNPAFKEYKLSDPDAFVNVIKNEVQALAAKDDFRNSDVYDKAKTPYENAFATLIFKYGNDPGMFNNAADYLVKPFVPGATETYVQEFVYASREAYKKYMAASGTKEEKQLASMVIVGSDFGWHLIMVTSVVTEGALYQLNYNELIGKPLSEEGKITGYEKSFTYSFNETYKSEIVSDAYSKVQSEVVDRYANISGYVTKHMNVLKDLY